MHNDEKSDINVGEFKIGDTVRSKVTGTEYTICEIKKHGINVYHGEHRGTYFFSFNEIEHAKSPKEDSEEKSKGERKRLSLNCMVEMQSARLKRAGV